jgi:hypothetical protein
MIEELGFHCVQNRLMGAMDYVPRWKWPRYEADHCLHLILMLRMMEPCLHTFFVVWCLIKYSDTYFRETH